MHFDVAHDELQLVPAGDGIVFWESVFADDAATDQNGYETTLTALHVSGCAGDSTIVLLDGVRAARAHAVVHSPDFLPASPGNVDAADLSAFAPVLGKGLGQAGYNPCMDIDPSGTSRNKCDAADLSVLASHMGHEAPGLSKGSDITFATTNVAFTEAPTSGGRAGITVALENGGDLSCFVLVLRTPAQHLQFMSWSQHEELRADTHVFPFVDNQGPKVVLVFINASALSGARVELGTIEFATNQEIDLEDDIEVEFAQGADADGTPWPIGRTGKVQNETGSTLVSRLQEVAPNPFNPNTIIRYSLASNLPVRLSIYDALGRLVRILVDDHQAPNVYGVTWNGRDNRGAEVSSGICLLSLRAGHNHELRKVALIR